MTLTRGDLIWGGIFCLMLLIYLGLIARTAYDLHRETKAIERKALEMRLRHFSIPE